MVCLSIELLGPPAIVLQAQAHVARLGTKDLALLAYLAVEHAHSHRREHLAGLLWPEKPEPAARTSLRQALYHLRSTLDPAGACISITAQEVHFDLVAGCRLDVAEFDALLDECDAHPHTARSACPPCAARLQRAVELYRGDLLAGFFVSDSVAFEEWAEWRREKYRQRAMTALRDLAEHHGRLGDGELVEKTVQRLTEIDPYDEVAHRQIMRALADRGQRAAALHHYEALRTTLAEELGVAPEPETAALAARIRLHTPAATPAGHRVASLALDRPLFVGREQELARLNELWCQARSGPGGIALISGEAGQGKTALLCEFAQRLQAVDPDLVVIGGRGNAQTGIGDPYLPFREALGLLSGDLDVHWLRGALSAEHCARLRHVIPVTLPALAEVGPDLIGGFLPEASLLSRAADYLGATEPAPPWVASLTRLAQRPPSAVPPQASLLEQYVRVLRAVARQRPLLLLLDDLQWADLGSISLLFHVARGIEGSPILLACAYRPAELTFGPSAAPLGAEEPTAPASRHPMLTVLNELKRRWGEVEISLNNVEDPGFVDALLDTEPNRLSSAFRRTLFRQTRGHPLFTVELLRGMQERGDLVRDQDGNWVAGATLDWETLPARVEAVIAEHMGRLSVRQRQILDAASVEGETFTAEVVSQATGFDLGQVQTLLSDELAEQHRLVLAEGVRRVDASRLSRYRFRHILFQRFLYQGLDPVRRTWLHEATGAALEGLHGSHRDEVALQLARHFRFAGIVDKAIGYLAQAAAHAVQLAGNQEAIQLYQQALDLLATLPDTPERAGTELQLQIGITAPLVAEKGYGAAEVVRASHRAWALCQQLGETPQLFAALWWLATYYGSAAEHTTAALVLEQLADVAERTANRSFMALAQCLRGWHDFFRGNFLTARARLKHMISFYDPVQHRALAFVYGQDPGIASLAVAGPMLWALGDLEQALRRGEEALALAWDSPHPYSLAFTLTYVGILLGWRCDFAHLGEVAEACIRVSTQHNFPFWSMTGTHLRGWAQAGQGRIVEGIETMLAASALNEKAGVRIGRPHQFLTLAETHLAAGQIEEARQVLLMILAEVEANGEHYCTAEIHRLLGEAALASGHGGAVAMDAEAEVHFRQAIEIARAQAARSWELRATTSLARLWQRQGRVTEAHAMLAEIYGWFTEGHDMHDLREARVLLDDLGSHNCRPTIG